MVPTVRQPLGSTPPAELFALTEIPWLRKSRDGLNSIRPPCLVGNRCSPDNGHDSWTRLYDLIGAGWATSWSVSRPWNARKCSTEIGREAGSALLQRRCTIARVVLRPPTAVLDHNARGSNVGVATRHQTELERFHLPSRTNWLCARRVDGCDQSVPTGASDVESLRLHFPSAVAVKDGYIHPIAGFPVHGLHR